MTTSRPTPTPHPTERATTSAPNRARHFALAPRSTPLTFFENLGDRHTRHFQGAGDAPLTGALGQKRQHLCLFFGRTPRVGILPAASSAFPTPISLFPADTQTVLHQRCATAPDTRKSHHALRLHTHLTLGHYQVAWTTSAPIAESDVVLDKPQRFISQEALQRSATNLVRRGNLLVGTRVGVGKAVENLLDVAISQDLTGLILEKAIVARFLAFYFKQNEVQNYFEGRKRGTTIQGVSRMDVEQLPILLPPFPEQKAIAETLRTVQDAQEARRLELRLEREREAALMDELFRNGTQGEPLQETELGKLPVSWRVVKLGEVCKVERGKFSHRPRNDPAFYRGDIPFIQTGDVTNCGGIIQHHTQTLNEKGLSVSRIFPRGTIAITIAANIGYCGILDFDSAFPDSLIAITCGSGADAGFLNYYLMTQQPEMDRQAPQGTQKNINIEFLRPWKIPLPPLDQQKEIAAILRACDDKIRALEAEVAALDELFRAMLEELMSGRLRTVTL